MTRLALGLRHVLGVLAALAAGIAGLAGEQRPTQQVTPLTFTAVSTGGRHSCGVTAAGAAFCWGTNGPRGLPTERGSPSRQTGTATGKSTS